jgi:hypothetical protein
VFGVLGEDDSDFSSLKALIRTLAGDPRLPVKGKGCDGCGNLLTKGAKLLTHLAEEGCKWFVVAHDADGNDPDEVKKKVLERVVEKAGLVSDAAVIIPVQMIEAWILGDNEAVKHVIRSWATIDVPNPEGIRNPKKYLMDKSKNEKRKPLYDPPTHNPKVAPHLRPPELEAKCPSFKSLADFVRAKHSGAC